MDPRRPRLDPMVRQVGFVTSGSELPAGQLLEADPKLYSPAPVIIPPSSASQRVGASPPPTPHPSDVPSIRGPPAHRPLEAGENFFSSAGIREEILNPDTPSLSTGDYIEPSSSPPPTPKAPPRPPSGPKPPQELGVTSTPHAPPAPASSPSLPPPPVATSAPPTAVVTPVATSAVRPMAPQRQPLAAPPPASAPPATPSPILPAVQLEQAANRKAGMKSPGKSPASSGPATPTSVDGMRKGGGGGGGGTAVPSGGGGGEVALKTKTTKAERRAQQEAQRAAKGGGKTGTVKEDKPSGQHQKLSGQGGKKDLPPDKKPPPSTVGPSGGGGGAGLADRKPNTGGVVGGGGGDPKKVSKTQPDDDHKVAKPKKKTLVEQTETKNRVQLFAHLPQFVHSTQLPSLEANFFSTEPNHPHRAVYQVGLQFLAGDFSGGNARTVAMLKALREMISEYRTPPEKTYVRELTSRVNTHVSFLITCRPLGVGMGNAIRVLKQRLGTILPTVGEAEAREVMLNEIDRFIQDKIVIADRAIVQLAVQKIRPHGDVLLVYGCSHVVVEILLEAHRQGRKFRVVIADSRPKLEGLDMLRRLVGGGLECRYVQINAVSYMMQEVTKVVLGASAILANGVVVGRVGSAGVGMVAHAFRVPVLVCCETYKFHKRVQLDSVTSNELGDPDELVKVAGRPEKTELEGWEEEERLQLLNLSYDAMPAEYVTLIVTEIGMVPVTSVPVILREHRNEVFLF